MPFDQMQRYLVRFTLPDGEHLIAGFSSADIGVARQHYRRIVMMNPEAKYDPNTFVTPAAPEDVDKAIAELRARDPGRQLATDMGLDSPARILTNPEVVPGSQYVPDAQGLANQ